MTDLTYYKCLKYIKEVLDAHLTDLYVTVGGTRSNDWIHICDDPKAQYVFPLIQISKVDSPSNIISIGSNFWEKKTIIVNIIARIKKNFKVTIDAEELRDKRLCEYYVSIIDKCLKDYNGYLKTTYGLGGFKVINTIHTDQDPVLIDTYYTGLQVRYWWFEQ